MTEEIKKMQAEKLLLLDRIKKLDTAIVAFQAVCDHNFLYEGHDSHYEIYKCTICSKTYKQ